MKVTPVLTWSVFLVWINHLVEPAIADQPPIGHGQVRALGHDRLLHLHHLGHVVRARPELTVTNPLVNSVEHLNVHITPFVDPP